MAGPWEKYGAQPAQQGGVFALPPTQEEVERAKRQAAADKRAEDRQSSDIAAREETLRIRRAAEARAQAEWNAKFNPDGTPKVAPKRNTERSAQIKTVLDNIERLRGLSDKNLSVGSWSKYFQDNPMFGQNRQNVEGAVDMVFGDLIQQQIAVLSEMNGGKGVATMANTQEEARRMAAAIANLSPDQSREEFLRGLKRAEDYYLRQAAQIEGTTPSDPKLREKYQPNSRRDDDNPLAATRAPSDPGFADGGDGEKSIPIPQPMQDEHAAYLAQNWGRIQPEDYAAFRADLDGKYGFTPNPDAYLKVAPRLNERAMQGGKPDGLNIPPVNAKMDGMDQLNASLFNNKAGGFIFGAGDQLGIADELAGGFNSLIKGTDYDVEVARADAMKQAMQGAYPGMNLTGNVIGALATGAGAAKAFPGLTGAFTNTTKRAVGTGAGFGALSGAGEMNDNRLLGVGIGGGLGVAGGAAGATVAPLLSRAMGTQTGQAASRAGRSIWNHTGGKVMPSMAVSPGPMVPQFSKGEGLLPANVLESAIPNLQDADRLGLPFALADADPQLRALAGSVSRRSADARQMAENIFEPRARGQADRLVSAIDQRLAPVTDINARSADIMKGANIEAGPYYSRAKAQPALDDPVVGSILNTKTGKDALKRAYGLASNERRDPSQLGFIYDEATGGVRINDADRYYKPEAPHESGIISGAGNRAPDDLVTFARQRGGLRDQAGELSHMGFNNAGRRGVPFAGQDTRAGPLVNDGGMNLDEFGEAAWEAGYFAERPTTAQVLDALRGTYDGGQRVFRPDDQGIVDDYFARQGDRYAANASDLSVDSSQPAGPRPFAPAEAYGKEVALPTYETLHYVRQGFDDILDGYRDKVTGKVNLDNEGRAISSLRRDLSDRLQQNPDFRQGDAIYSKGAKRRDALRDGFEVMPRNNVPFRDFDQRLSGARAYDDNFTQEADRLVPEMQRGFATNMADTADKMRLSGNPWEAVYGAPNQQEKIGALFPNGAQDFGRQYGLERDMAKTAYETLGGSPTALRQATDQQFDSGLMGVGSDLAADVAGGGGAFTLKSMMGRGVRALGDTARLKGGKSKADAIAPVLFAPNPRMTLDYIADLTERQIQAAKRTGRYRRGAGLFGSILPSSFLGSE